MRPDPFIARTATGKPAPAAHVKRQLCMTASRHFNPDHYLETDLGRVFTPERSAAAFEQAYAELSAALHAASVGSRLFVVIGVQAAGKSHWVQSNAARLGQNAYFFDAALPQAKHRQRVLGIAKDCGVPAVAVWVQAPLEAALERNHARRADHRVPEAALRSVYATLEPPTVSEGFVQIMEVAYAT